MMKNSAYTAEHGSRMDSPTSTLYVRSSWMQLHAIISKSVQGKKTTFISVDNFGLTRLSKPVKQAKFEVFIQLRKSDLRGPRKSYNIETLVFLCQKVYIIYKDLCPHL